MLLIVIGGMNASFDKMERGRMGSEQNIENFVEFARLFLAGCKTTLECIFFFSFFSFFYSLFYKSITDFVPFLIIIYYSSERGNRMQAYF